jgi:hypothetical protein
MVRIITILYSTPTLEEDHDFKMADLLRFAGVAPAKKP